MWPSGKNSEESKMRSKVAVGKKQEKLKMRSNVAIWKKIDKNSKCAAMCPLEKNEKI